VPFVAFLVWWYVPLYNEMFTSMLVPIFHALQYLTFVGRVESSGLAAYDERTAHARLAVFAFALVVAGILVFELVPNALDRWAGTATTMNATFFLGAGVLFFNLHHYAIDSAIWRMRDPHVREVLFFRSPRPA
jgi:hypothetical protein